MTRPSPAPRSIPLEQLPGSWAEAAVAFERDDADSEREPQLHGPTAAAVLRECEAQLRASIGELSERIARMDADGQPRCACGHGAWAHPPGPADPCVGSAHGDITRQCPCGGYAPRLIETDWSPT